MLMAGTSVPSGKVDPTECEDWYSDGYVLVYVVHEGSSEGTEGEASS